VTAFAFYVEKAEKRLKHWEGKLDNLAEKALNLQHDQQEELEKRRVQLQTKLDLTQGRLEALRSAGDRGWEAFKSDLEHSFRDFEQSFKE
jgi:vacuolar-type H+-ATPase subunit I/STV1